MLSFLSKCRRPEPRRFLTDFLSYLNDHDKTAVSFDEEGYYKTGDFARLVGEDYVIEGRGSTDCMSTPLQRSPRRGSDLLTHSA